MQINARDFWLAVVTAVARVVTALIMNGCYDWCAVLGSLIPLADEVVNDSHSHLMVSIYMV